jgi:23S rRNA (cytosine1962-C5)-methyltransferase
MTQGSPTLPSIRLKPRGGKRLLRGHPWIYSNEIAMDREVKALPAGSLVELVGDDGHRLGVAMFNPQTLISARLLSRDPKAEIDQAFLAGRLRRALAIRERLIEAPCYRLIHAEADGLPGTVVDRFDDTLVVQVNSAGMERLTPPLLAALDEVVAPGRVVLRNDSPARAQEGLDSRVEVVKGRLEGPVELVENGARFFADVIQGQKTGWFFDQRENRAWASRLAGGARVLDCYAFTGGFGIAAALAGAGKVTLLDRSGPALDLAGQAAEANGVAERCAYLKAEVFGELGHLAKSGESFEVVIADPPAFVKSKRELAQGIKGYRKLARLAAALVARDGFLVIASCSHHVDAASFAEQVRRGLMDAGREARLLRCAGAGADHPQHPALPESAYLKALFLALD